MAATLTDDLTRVSVADIEKWDEGPDGTVYVYGRCTTPEVDTDEQVVDSGWSGPALKEYLATAPTVRVQHNPQRDPAGSAVRVDVNRDGDGAHWLKAAVDEPIAARLVKRGHLRAFSVGIARPVIERDISGKARGGVIKGGKIVEVSLVDSPANRSCFLEIAKSAADGTCEFTGKVFADEDVIQKALGGDDLLTKGDGGDFVNVDLPKGASISISPADFARLRTFKQELVTKAAGTAVEADAEKRDFDRGVGGGVDRDKLPDSDFAGPHRSFPIVTQSDVSDALSLVGHADNPDAVRARIHAIARRKGFSVPDDSDSKSKGAEEAVEQVVEKAEAPAEPAMEPVAEKAADAPDEQQEATPDVTKDPAPKPVKKAKGGKGGKKKLPPWLNKPADDDADSKSGSDGKDDDASKACKSVTDHLWTGIEGTSDIECSKCHTTPAQAAGVTASAMNPAPVGELMESQGPASVKGATPASASGAVGESMKPVPAHREPDGAPMEAFEKDSGMSDGDDEKPARLEAAAGMKSADLDLAPDPEVAALLRFKMTGADEDLGRLHDLTCPAFHPEQVAKYHPYADLGTLIDSGAWQRKTLAAAAGPLEAAMKAQEAWQDALLLKTADPADLNDWRLELHKAFRDANPGPGSFPTPGSVSPQSYSRPVLTDGRAATATDYGAPNTSPQVASSAPDAHSFDRPPLSAGHSSPSPSFMKASFEYPSETGVPTQLSYAAMQKEAQRQALARMHEHLSRQFPPVCPMDLDGPQQAENHPVPVPAGIGKGDAEPTVTKDEAPVDVPMPGGGYYPASVNEVLKAPAEQDGLFMDADVYKGFKKQRKKLGKKVLSGSMTVDEARAKLGRQFAQKGAEPPAEVAKAAAVTPVSSSVPGAEVVYNMNGSISPDVIKAAVREALRAESVPLEAATIQSFDPGPSIEAAVTKAVTPLLEKIQAQDTKLAETQRVIDAIADQPDPSTAAFSGLAFQPQVIKSRRPAAVPDQAEYAARAQQMVRRNLQHTYQTHSDPHVREAAGQSLATMGVGMEAPPMT